MPGKGVNMGDGWETKRNRVPGNVDWVIIRLAKPGIIQKILVDTAHFKGNYPDTCSLEACFNKRDAEVKNGNVFWQEILPQQKLEADQEHIFIQEVNVHSKVSHVRFKIYPDGGVSRLRIYGTIQA
jgi:allantoicase